MSCGQSAIVRSGVTASEISRKRTAQSPLWWFASVSGLEPSQPCVACRAIQAAGAQSSRRLASFRRDSRPARSFQGSLRAGSSMIVR